MKLDKTQTGWGVAAAALTMAGVLVSPQASAASKAEHALQATDSKVQALEAQVNQMSQMLQSMQDELNRVRTAASRSASENTAKVQELDQWMASVKSAPVASESKDNMVFFRGGWADMDHTRSGVSIPEVGRDVGVVQRGDDEGWYIGAGFDFSLNDDLFGLMDDTEVLAELMFEWKDFGRSAGVGVSTDGANFGDPNLDGSVGVNATLTPKTVSVSQLTLSAAPKIKFMKGSALRPWIIPIGLAAHVISPPSEAITVFNPGLMFGGGADYHLWNNIYVGVDARYHLTSRSGDEVNTDGYTAGGYIGIGF
ncbi:MAG: porin family protein [Gammaproteobacteria bacterium]